MEKVSDGSNNDTEVKQAYITVQDLVADFSASQTTVPVGGSITYTNLSSCASTYNWTFDGGFPASSTDENPGAVVYNTAGDFDVSLEVSNGTSTDTKVITISVVDIQYCSSAGNNGYEWISSIDIEKLLLGDQLQFDDGNAPTLDPAIARLGNTQYFDFE